MCRKVKEKIGKDKGKSSKGNINVQDGKKSKIRQGKN